MDSMVGYKNEKNLYFGRFAAKLDDVVNFIPSRVAALLMIVASFLPGKRFSGLGHGRSGEGTAGNMPARILRRPRVPVREALASGWQGMPVILERL